MNELPSRSGRQLLLPYCLQKMEDGRYIALNRRYKPLGMDAAEWLTYEAIPHLQRLRISEAQAAQLDHRGAPDPDRIYLYPGDGLDPRDTTAWNAYCARLALLAELRSR